MRGAKTAMDEVSKKGAFVRTESQFRNWIKADGSTKFAPEAGRYHLVVSYACPWASRCLFLRSFKGLEDAIAFTTVRPVMVKTSEDPEDKHHGWEFDEPFHGAKTVRAFYESKADNVAKFTVPILYDEKLGEIVSNESSEIIRMFNSEFNDFATKNKDVDLYPEELRAEIDATNEWVYPWINNGVYRSGFAQTQEAYDEAVTDVFKGLDRAEEVLAAQRYIASSEEITEADVRLFVTLVRFDEVYHGHFKCNKRLLVQYPNIHNYVREIYQIPGIADTVNMDHIKEHYHRSHPTINKFGIVPIGQDAEAGFKEPHDREAKFPLSRKKQRA